MEWAHTDSIDVWGDYAFTSLASGVNTERDEYKAALEAYMATLPPDEQETAWYEYASGYRTLPTLTLSLSAKLNTIPAGFCIKGLLPDTVTAIASQAYLSVVTDFKLSPSLDDIAVDAFVKGSTFVVEAGSYAELWCGENGFGYTLEGQDSLDWLNN